MNTKTESDTSGTMRLHTGRLTLAATLIMLLLVFLDARAQRFGRWNTEQNNPAGTEVIVARWTFGHNGWFGGYGWAHNYPDSDQHLNQYIAAATGIDIERMSYRIVELGVNYMVYALTH